MESREGAAPEAAASSGGAEGTSTGATSPALRTRALVSRLRPELARGRTVDVLVQLREGAEATGVATARLLASVSPGGVELRHRYQRLPVLAVRVHTLAGLEQLAAHGDTEVLHENARYYPSLAYSLPLIGQSEALAAGHGGAGTTVVVVDTGLDYRHAAFGACASAGDPGCRVSYTADFATDDGSLDDMGHGTNVAAIVAGVAPEAKLVGLDVFGAEGYATAVDILRAIDWSIAERASRNIVAINLSLGGGGVTAPCGTDIFALAIERARAAGILTTVAAGNDGFVEKLNSPACAPAALSVGAVYSRTYGRIAYQSCTDASPKADSVTCFSNSASFLSLLAPGALIQAGGFTMAGTSQAAPHVAGALAVLRAAFPDEGAEDAVARVLRSRTYVEDARNGVRKPRLDLPAALSACSATLAQTRVLLPLQGGSAEVLVRAPGDCAWSVSGAPAWLDAAPVGSGAVGEGAVRVTVAASSTARSATLRVGGTTLTVEQGVVGSAPVAVVVNGGAEATNSAAVTVQVMANKSTTIASVCLSNTTSCSLWVPYTGAAFHWLLTAGDGEKTVYVRARTTAGAVLSTVFSGRIVVDTVAPVDGEMNVVRVDSVAHISWASFSDFASGVRAYSVVYGASVPPSCDKGELVYKGAATSFRHDGLDPKVTYYYRVCAHDGAGNLSAGVSELAPPWQPTGEAR